MTTTVTLYRCAKCGSGNLIPYANGKRIKHPVISTLKQQHADTYHCPDCGTTLDYCMNSAEKNILDSIVTLGQDTAKTQKYLEKYPNMGICPINHAIYQGRTR